MGNERLNVLLEQARLSFRKHAAEQRSVIADLCERAGEGDAIALDALRRLVHQFHGTAGTLGYAALGEAAGDVEAAIAAGAPLEEIRRRCDLLQEKMKAIA